MTPEQITQWACEAGFSPQSDEWVFNTMLRTFANLVRNATLEEAAVRCEKYAMEVNASSDATLYAIQYTNAGTHCAKEIRSLK